MIAGAKDDSASAVKTLIREAETSLRTWRKQKGGHGNE